jgi:hypothetical protein
MAAMEAALRGRPDLLQQLATINARLAAIEGELEAAYLRWDELESLKNP